MDQRETNFRDSKGNHFADQQEPPFLSSFMIELIERIKNTFVTMRGYTQISREKFSDREFGEYYYRTVNEDIDKMDMVLNSLLHYMKVQNPVRKTNTVHHLLEEVLKKYQAKLDEKGIRIIKKFENDLPETIVPDEQLRYIFSSIIQYAITSTPPGKSIGLSTKSLTSRGETESKNLFQKDGRYIDVTIVFSGPLQSTLQGSSTPSLKKEEPSMLILRFVKEVVQRNHGVMRMGTDEKKTRTILSLRFPVERRKIFYYPSMN